MNQFQIDPRFSLRLKTLRVRIAFVFLLFTASSLWATPPYQVVGYCLQTQNANGGTINWSTDVPWSDLTVVADAFAIPSTSDTFDFNGGGAKGNTLITAAHNHGVRCIISLGGSGQDGSFPTLCSTAANRAAFASAVTAMVAQYGYDGVDLDWETPNAASQANATAMVEAIYNDIKALPNSTLDGKPRTLSFTTVDYIFGIYNITTLANYSDWCFYMGYDWYDGTGANGPLNGDNPAIATSIPTLVNGTNATYPKDKIILGCPLYANDYGPGTEIPVLTVLTTGVSISYNSSWAEADYRASDGNTVYVDTAQSYCDKINWAMSYGLEGIGMWDMGQGLPYTNSAVTGIWSDIGGTSSCLTVVGPTSTPTSSFTPTKTFTASPTKTATSTATASFTPTATLSKTPTATATSSFTPTSTASKTPTATASGTPTSSFTPSWTASPTPSKTPTATASSTPSNTPVPPTSTFTSSATATSSATSTPTPTFTRTSTPTNTSTASPTASRTPTPSSTSTATPSGTPSSTSTASPTATHSSTPTNTSTASATSTVTDTPQFSFTPTSTPTKTSTATASMTASATASRTPTASFTMTGTSSFTPTPSPTATASKTSTSSPTASFTPSSTRTSTATSTPLNTSTATPTPTVTDTPQSSFTPTSTPTKTSTATASMTATPSSTSTASRTATMTPTSTSTQTFTPTSTASGTPSATATRTATVTATPTRTFTPTFTESSTPSSTPTASATSTRSFTPTLTPTDSTTATPTSSPTSTVTRTFTPTVTPTVTLTPSSTPNSPLLTPNSTPVVYPNPSTGSGPVHLLLNLPQGGEVKVKLFTTAFRKVWQRDFPNEAAGEDRLTLDLPTIANGIYYLVVEADGKRWVVKLMVLG